MRMLFRNPFQPLVGNDRDPHRSQRSDIVFPALQGNAVQVDEVAGQVQLQYLPLPVIKLLVAADHAFDEKVALAERDAFANKDPAAADLLYLADRGGESLFFLDRKSDVQGKSWSAKISP